MQLKGSRYEWSFDLKKERRKKKETPQKGPVMMIKVNNPNKSDVNVTKTGQRKGSKLSIIY